MVLKSGMKLFAVILVFALAVGGCTTRSNAKAQAQAAFQAGQITALRQQQQEQTPVVTIVGPVQNQRVPWVAGLTLARELLMANLEDSRVLLSELDAETPHRRGRAERGQT